MKYLKFIFLGLGFVLLGLILRQTNLQEVWQQIHPSRLVGNDISNYFLLPRNTSPMFYFGN
jgi:hypothetical protein